MPRQSCVCAEEDVRLLAEVPADVSGGHDDADRGLGAEQRDGPRGGETLAQLLGDVQRTTAAAASALLAAGVLEALLIGLRALDLGPDPALKHADKICQVLKLGR